MAEINTDLPVLTDLAVFDALLARVTAAPAEFPDAPTIARSAKLSVRKLTDLLGIHAHLTPQAWLRRLRARAAATNLLDTKRKTAQIAADVGFADEKEFEAQFLEEMRLMPAAYRALGRASSFHIPLPEGYRSAEVLAYHARDPEGRTERSAGNQIWKALTTADGPVILQLTLDARQVTVQVHSDHRIGPRSMATLHDDALHMLGLVNQIDHFERQHAAFVKPRRGLRLPLIPRGFDALCWAITGQQINLAFASALRRAMIGVAGEQVGNMITHPTAQALADLPLSALTALRYSGSKARYLIDAAGAVATGKLDIENLTAGSAVAAEAALIAQRGVGTWTARYVLMRRGFADSAPVGDSALATALQRVHALSERPDAADTERLMSRYAPNRSLASMHLWTLLKEPREV